MWEPAPSFPFQRKRLNRIKIPFPFAPFFTQRQKRSSSIRQQRSLTRRVQCGVCLASPWGWERVGWASSVEGGRATQPWNSRPAIADAVFIFYLFLFVFFFDWKRILDLFYERSAESMKEELQIHLFVSEKLCDGFVAGARDRWRGGKGRPAFGCFERLPCCWAGLPAGECGGVHAYCYEVLMCTQSVLCVFSYYILTACYHQNMPLHPPGYWTNFYYNKCWIRCNKYMIVLQISKGSQCHVRPKKTVFQNLCKV